MKTSVLGAAIATVVSLAATPPVAAQGGDRDVRCVIVANVFAQAEKEPAKKQLAAVSGLYYLGRADARLGPPQFKAAMLAERKLLNAKTVSATMTACAQTFIARQRSLKALGQELGPAQIKK